MPEYTKPIPVPDERTSGFWEAAKRHQLAFQRCQHCGHYFHPPTIVCSNCQAYEPSFVWEPVSGRGQILSWVIYQDAFVPGFKEEIPWVNVMVTLDEQSDLIFLAGLVDGPNAVLKVGMPVQVTFQEITPDITLPHFKLASSTK